MILSDYLYVRNSIMLLLYATFGHNSGEKLSLRSLASSALGVEGSSNRLAPSSIWLHRPTYSSSARLPSVYNGRNAITLIHIHIANVSARHRHDRDANRQHCSNTRAVRPPFFFCNAKIDKN